MDIQKILKELSIDEKISLLCGKDSWHTENIDRLGLRSITMNDGPHGLRIPLDEGGSIPATCFPPAATFACSYDNDLIESVGSAIAKECKNHDVDILLGPGFNIKRSPLCGRNFEYYSEDPYVCASLASSFVKGVQKEGVGACVKHYAVNSQENFRLTIDSTVDERALREIYLKAFEKVVKDTNPFALMASYNRINGLHGCENTHLLNDILRNEWGYKGLVMSDWGAVNDIVASIKAGMDLEMPSSFGQGVKKLKQAYLENRLSEEEIDRAVEHTLITLERSLNRTNEPCDYEANHNLARQVAKESFVLLKNENVLPLNENEKVLFVGEMIKKPILQGGGSSKIVMTKIDSLEAYLKKKNNYDYVDGYRLGKGFNPEVHKEVLSKAENYDKIVLFVGQELKDVTEGVDRKSMELNFVQTRLINDLAKLNKKLIVVLAIGSAIYMPWIDKVDAVLNIHLLGQAGASGVVETLYGDNNPSGKLTETYAKSIDDSIWNKYYHKGNKSAYYQESIYVGYRYYDTFNKEVLFPFGHGLSYSKFEYSNLNISKSEDKVLVSLDVENVSDIDGKEIVQLYISKKDSKIFRSKHELRKFKKVLVKSHEIKKVEFELSNDDFTYYDTNDSKFVVEEGEYIIEVGASSRDIRLTEEVVMNGKKENFPNTDLQSYYDGSFSDLDFSKLLNRELPLLNHPKGKFHENSTISDLKKTFIGSIVAKVIVSKSKGQQDAEDIFEGGSFEDTLNFMPLRALSNMSGGQLPEEMMYAIIDVCNYNFIKAFRKLRGK